jgi:hypothetical protein
MARKKLRWSAFVELNQMILADLPDTVARWHGLRVIAGDSTTLYLPTTHPDTIASSGDGFNCYHTDTGIYSQARSAALCEASTGLFSSPPGQFARIISRRPANPKAKANPPTLNKRSRAFEKDSLNRTTASFVINPPKKALTNVKDSSIQQKAS